MEMKLKAFNLKLKQYLSDVKIIERTHPSKAGDLWLEVCKFIVSFAKSKECPAPLRPKLAEQAGTIIQKVKEMKAGIRNSVYDARNTVLATSDLPSSLGSVSSSEDEDGMLSQLETLPDIPLETENDSNSIGSIGDTGSVDTSETSGPSLPFPLPNASSNDPIIPSDPSNMIPKGSSEFSAHLFGKLDELDAELKKLPGNLKEIKPTPFAGAHKISEKHSTIDQNALSSFDKDTETLDVTKSSIGKQVGSNPFQDPNSEALNSKSSSSLKIAGFQNNPFKKDQSPSDIVDSEGKPIANNSNATPHDPFGPSAIKKEKSNGDSGRLCYACGATLEPNATICSECQTENI